MCRICGKEKEKLIFNLELGGGFLCTKIVVEKQKSFSLSIGKEK